MAVTNATNRPGAFGAGMTNMQQPGLNGQELTPEDSKRLAEQQKLAQYQELVSMMSNIMKKKNEIAMTIINNMR